MTISFSRGTLLYGVGSLLSERSKYVSHVHHLRDLKNSCSTDHCLITGNHMQHHLTSPIHTTRLKGLRNFYDSITG